MYPFERFTERGKAVLATAQDEAEDSGAGYIGTEHLLVALLRVGGLAAQVLASLGAGPDRVRDTVDRRLDQFQADSHGRVVPTGRTKAVIELAIAEADRSGSAHVGTEHLLLALLDEGEGIGAQVLRELGMTSDLVRAEVERQLVAARAAAAGPAVRPRSARFRGGAPPSPELAVLLVAANRQANREFALELRPDHLLRAMAESGRPTAHLLASLGLDLDALPEALRPPDAVGRIESTIRDLRARREAAVAARDLALTARLRHEEAVQEADLRRAHEAWSASWIPGQRRATEDGR